MTYIYMYRMKERMDFSSSGYREDGNDGGDQRQDIAKCIMKL